MAASNGTLAVKQANVPPVIGALDIDVAGDAPAVAELASYDPINAMRFVGLTPEDFSGDVSGHVTADIPLQKGIDPSTLDWHVALDFENLSIAKPSTARWSPRQPGTITVEPDQGGDLTPRPSSTACRREIEAVEPLGKSGHAAPAPVTAGARRQGARSSGPRPFGPGYGTGEGHASTRRRAAAAADQRRSDRRATRHSLGGLEQGIGHRGDVEFHARETTETRRRFRISICRARRSALKGDIALVWWRPRRRKFANVAAQPRRRCRVAVKRIAARAYVVDISGDSLDARSLVKQFTADTGTATKARDSGSVSVDLDVDTLIGFHDERLSDVKLDYSGSGDRSNGLVVSATASSGAGVSDPQRQRTAASARCRCIGRCRRDPAVPRHLRAHGRRHDRRSRSRARATGR